jgi:hypothetical protein
VVEAASLGLAGPSKADLLSVIRRIPLVEAAKARADGAGADLNARSSIKRSPEKKIRLPYKDRHVREASKTDVEYIREILSRSPSTNSLRDSRGASVADVEVAAAPLIHREDPSTNSTRMTMAKRSSSSQPSKTETFAEEEEDRDRPQGPHLLKASSTINEAEEVAEAVYSLDKPKVSLLTKVTVAAGVVRDKNNNSLMRMTSTRDLVSRDMAEDSEADKETNSTKEKMAGSSIPCKISS